MKSFVSLSLFILAGLLTALLTGFRTDLLPGQIAYDEEQKGLQDRIVIKFNHVVAENTPKGLAAEKFATLVKEKTNGKVEVQVYPNSILFSDENEFEALMSGEIQMIAPAFSKLSNLVPAWSAMDLPFAFSNQKQLEKALHGDIGHMLFQTLEPKKMHGLAFWSNGFKQVTNKQKPLLLPEDFSGQRFRIMPSKVIESQYKMMNASTQSISFSEVYHNLESGFVDGQENTISNIYTKRLYQVQNYLTISNHGYLGYAVIVNKDFWEKIPNNLQTNIVSAVEETTEWANEVAVTMNDKQLKLLKETTNLTIQELTPEQRLLWIKTLDPVYTQFTPIIGQELVNKIKHLREQR